MNKQTNNNVRVLSTKKITPTTSTNKKGKEKKKKKKKKHIFGKILLTFFIVFIVIPIGLVYALCFDNKWEDIKASEDTVDEIFDRVKVDSLDTTSNYLAPKVQIRLTQEDLNGFLKSYTQEFTQDNPLMKFVNNFYIKIKEDRYEFVFELKTKIFCTKIILQAEFQEIADRDDYTKSYFDFKIITLKVGRLSGFNALIKKLINSETLTGFFNDAGISVQVDLENEEIRYYEKDLIEDLKKQEGFEEDDLYFTLIDDAFQKRLLKFDFNSDQSMTIFMPLKDMHYSEMFSDDDKSLDLVFAEKRDIVVEALNKGIANEDNAGNLFDYLIHGYEFSKQDASFTRSFPDGSLDEIGIEDIRSYEGYEEISILNPNYSTLDERIANSVNPAALTDSSIPIACLTENEINNFLCGSEMIGVKSLFMRKINETDWKANYVAINDFYCDITEDGINYVVGVDINGYSTVLSFVTVFEEINEYKLQFNTEHVFYGDHEATESMKAVIFQLLADAIEADVTMGVQIVGSKFIFDFARGIDESGYGSYIDPSMAKIRIETAIDGNGRICFVKK